MSTVIIKQPNLRKLRGEQQKILQAISQSPGPISAYVAAPMSSLTNAYHSRSTTLLIKGGPDEAAQVACGVGCAADSEEPAAPPNLLYDIFNTTSHVNLDVEKTLSLACKVLSKARTQLSELSDDARQSLGRITEFGNSLAILPRQQGE